MKAKPTLSEMIGHGIIRVPATLHAMYKGRPIKATLLRNGTIELDGATFNSLSVAAGTAIVKAGASASKGRRYRHANGWTFWKVEIRGRRISLSRLRDFNYDRSGDANM